MLLRNRSVREGMCNGTRMVVDSMGDENIWCRRLGRDGQLSAELYGIPRIPFEYDDSDTDKTGLQFRRLEFPLKLAFDMTIAKAQGQTVPGKLGLDLATDVFGPGQAYVALSRTRDGGNVTILTRQPPQGERPTIRNIVWDWNGPQRVSEQPAIIFPEVNSDDEAGKLYEFSFQVGLTIITIR